MKTNSKLIAVLGTAVAMSCGASQALANADTAQEEVDKQIARLISNAISDRVSEQVSEESSASSAQRQTQTDETINNVYGTLTRSQLEFKIPGFTNFEADTDIFMVGGDHKINERLTAGMSVTRSETQSNFLRDLVSYTLTPYAAFIINEHLFSVLQLATNRKTDNAGLSGVDEVTNSATLSLNGIAVSDDQRGKLMAVLTLSKNDEGQRDTNRRLSINGSYLVAPSVMHGLSVTGGMEMTQSSTNNSSKPYFANIGLELDVAKNTKLKFGYSKLLEDDLEVPRSKLKIDTFTIGGSVAF